VDDSSKKRRVQNEILKLPYWVLSVSLLLTFGATYIFHKSARENDIARFQNETAAIENRVEMLINGYIVAIKSGRGFIESNPDLDKGKFADFVKSLELKKNYGAINGIGFWKRPFPGENNIQDDSFRVENFRDFSLFSESNGFKQQTFNVLESKNDGDPRAVSFLKYNETSLQSFLNKARDSGEAVITGKLNFTQENLPGKQTGFLIFLPIYKSGYVPSTIEEKHRLLDGYVYSPLQAENFEHDLRRSISAKDIAVTIYDNEQHAENILAQTNPGFLPDRKEIVGKSAINIAGGQWIVEYHALPSFILQSSTGWSPIIFISGLIFSLLLFGMTYLETYARARAETIADDLRESEREKAFLLEKEQIERKRAQEANKAKDEFIAIVSHELRTPLNSIAGWSKVLNTENLSPLTKERALQKIDKNLRVQTEIVEELLDFSQLISNTTNLTREKIDFSDLFNETFNRIENVAKEMGISLAKNNSATGLSISGDRALLQSVIKNLLSNAMKFTPQGGRINAELMTDSDHFVMKITDTGHGIQPEFLPHIFESFKQADSSTTRKYGGLGLGLAITRRIVELHGGTIQAESEGEGKGAVFTVRLPFNQ
jgi:signal transduction histidine kinase